MPLMRRFVFWSFYYSGLVALVRLLHRNTLTVLLYHGVAPQQDIGIYNYRKKFIEPEAFEHQLEYFNKHYAVLPLDEAVERLQAGTLPPYALAITFDDGYENNYRYAYPLLKRLKLPATIFVTTDFVFEKKPLWVDRLEYASGAGDGPRAQKEAADANIRDMLKRLPEHKKLQRLSAIEAQSRVLADFKDERAVYAPLEETQMREMEASGLMIGAHTRTHPILSHLSPDDARSEILGSKLELQRRGFKVSSIFAYPNGQRGDWTAETESATKAAEFTGALTTLEGLNSRTTPLMQLRRMTMDGTDASPAFAVIAVGMRGYMSRVKRLFS